ncbi:MAG: Cof-type HAD-IIB family hydrolase [Christensenellales bacterium]
MQYKLLVMDIDDTLLTSGGELSPRTTQAVRAAKKLLPVILATGRMYRAAKRFAEALEITTPMIAFGGAQIVDPASGELLYQCGISGELAREIVLFGREHGLAVQAYDKNDYLYEKPHPYLPMYYHICGFEGKQVPDLLAINLDTPKILLMGEKETVDIWLPVLRRKYEGKLSFSTSKPQFLEVNNIRSGKANAIGFLAKKMGVLWNEIIAIGDGRIDIPMLEKAGLGIAVGNAIEEVKAAADETTCTNDEDGVAQAIEKYILKRME